MCFKKWFKKDNKEEIEKDIEDVTVNMTEEEHDDTDTEHENELNELLEYFTARRDAASNVASKSSATCTKKMLDRLVDYLTYTK